MSLIIINIKRIPGQFYIQVTIRSKLISIFAIYLRISIDGPVVCYVKCLVYANLLRREVTHQIFWIHIVPRGMRLFSQSSSWCSQELAGILPHSEFKYLNQSMWKSYAVSVKIIPWDPSHSPRGRIGRQRKISFTIDVINGRCCLSSNEGGRDRPTCVSSSC